MDHTVVHFDIPAKDVAKLRKFYATLFGWKIEKWPGPGMEYWVIETVPSDKRGNPLRPGVNGGMGQKERDEKPLNYISVESVDEYSKNIEKLGGKITIPKTEIPGIGWFAVAFDPEGNPFAIMQPMEMQ
jgi:predicted enzyme related to lactoylglutathione lyase